MIPATPPPFKDYRPLGREALHRGGLMLASSRSTSERWHLWVFVAPLFLTTIFAKFGLSIGDGAITLSTVLMLLVALSGLMFGMLRLEPTRLPLLLLVLSVLAAMQILQNDRFKVTSFAMMTALYSLYAVYSPHAARQPSRALDVFRHFASFIGVVGIIQFASQFLIGNHLMFPIETLVPRHLLIPNFNFTIPLSYGSSTFKSNGVFLLEPSFFSQFMALALLVELSAQNSYRRMAVYVAAMIVSYSGTGIVVLIVCLPILVIKEERWDLLAFAGLSAILLVVFASQLNLDVYLQRATEVDSTRSSAFHRFAGGFKLFEQFLWSDPWRAFLGFGAGSNAEFLQLSFYPFAEMALTKIVFEFGLLGALVHFGFVGYCVFQSRAPFFVKMGCAVMYFMNGMYTPATHGIALTLLVWPASGELNGVPQLHPTGRSLV